MKITTLVLCAYVILTYSMQFLRLDFEIFAKMFARPCDGNKFPGNTPSPLDTNLEGFHIILVVIYNDASSSTVLSVELLLCQTKL